MAGDISIGGLSSGLQVEEIIQKLSQIEQRSITPYQDQQQTLKSRLSAFQEANTRLLAVRDAAGQLASTTFFSNRTAASSDDNLLTAAAEIGATPGEYVIRVESLARAHQKLSQSFADLDNTTVGAGTIAFTAGGKTSTIQVDSSNNTLRGLRDAINAANGNVRAAIIQDGDSSYRLMVSSKETGTANGITLNSTLSGGAAPTFTDLQTAGDATIKLGEGETALTITRSGNAIRDVVPGVTLNLAGADVDKAVTVSVTQDRTKIQEGVQKLVDQYNNAIDYFKKQFSYNSETGEGGVLLGDFTLKNAQDELTRGFSGVVAGVDGAQSLADLGLSLDSNSKLTLNAARLQEKLSADPESVMRVFALSAESTHGGVQLVSAGPKTKVEGTAYAVEVTQAARRARVTSGAAQTGALDADETLTINGKSIALTSGMTQAQVLTAINAQASETGVIASATGAGGAGSGSHLTFRSVGHGASAAVSIVSSRSSSAGSTTGVGNVAATQASGGGETGSGTGEAGLDVAGSINGEAAIGKGQILTGNTGNTHTEGLALRISAGTTGFLGSIKLFNGVAHAVQQTLDQTTDAANGPIQGQEDNLQTRIDYLQKIIDERGEAAKRKEETIRDQFNRLEALMSQFQSQSSYLSSQLKSLG
jgi:flagellar hook-associated protein 2